MATEKAERATTRNTIQRALVLEAVQSLHNHPTSADVYEVVRARHPNISRATVYRNLGVLDDIVSQVSDAHGFTIEHHEIIFDGVCAHCKASAEN